MSSVVAEYRIREALRFAFPTVDLVQALAERVDNEALPALWQSITFVPAGDVAVSIGSPACRRETGTARIFAVGRTGAGDAEVIAHADQVAAYFRNWRWVEGGETIRVELVAAGARAPESDGRWIIVSTDVNFVHDYYA